MKRLGAFAAVVLALVVGPAVAASAHPLGNFTVNQYSGLRVGAERVDVDLVVDMLSGPIYHRLLITGGPVTPRVAGELADLVLEAIAR